MSSKDGGILVLLCSSHLLSHYPQEIVTGVLIFWITFCLLPPSLLQLTSPLVRMRNSSWTVLPPSTTCLTMPSLTAALCYGYRKWPSVSVCKGNLPSAPTCSPSCKDANSLAGSHLQHGVQVGLTVLTLVVAASSAAKCIMTARVNFCSLKRNLQSKNVKSSPPPQYRLGIDIKHRGV